MFFLVVCLFSCAASGFGKPFGDPSPYVYSYPSYYGGYQPFYQQPIVEPLRFYHSQPIAYSAFPHQPEVNYHQPEVNYHQHQQPIQAVPYPLIAAYTGYQGQPGYGYPNPGFVLGYDATASHVAQSPDMVAEKTEEKKDEAKEQVVDHQVMSRSGATNVEAHGGDMAMVKEEVAMEKEDMTMAGEEMMAMASMPEKQARIFGSVGYPFGTNLQSYKQPVLVNGNQGQKVSVLGNQYLLKLASTTKNRDGSLAGSIYPEIGAGTIFNTPASNYNSG